MYSFTIKETCGAEDSKTSASRFLQSPFWAQFKCSHGWKNKRFDVTAALNGSNAAAEDSTAAETVHCTVSVLLRSFGKAGLRFSIAYIPLAPEVPSFTDTKDSNAVEHIREYTDFLTGFAKTLSSFLPKNTLCIRYDIPLDFYTCEDRDFYNHSLINLSKTCRLPVKKTHTDIQPPDTVLLDLSKSPDELLSCMKPKWRYNIHLAEKKGVTVTPFTADSADLDTAIDTFYALFETTAKRDGIAVHAKTYYKDLFALSKTFPNAPKITLWLAKHEDDSLAGIITLFCKREAVYLYGASSNVKRNLMPAYLLQWNAIQSAKEYGSAFYDFYGMPPTDDEHHPMYGLYRFKTGFGGTIVHRPGSVDVPVSPFYSFYIAAERLRAFYHKRIKKLLAGR